MAAARAPTLLAAFLLLLVASLELFARSAADNSPECPYPCLPPPTSGVATLPPPPPSQYGALPYPPPPPQPYTPGWLPPPSTVSVYQPPGLVFPAPPPPNPIMPYFPYYFRTPNAAPLLKGGRLWLAMALSSSMLVQFLLH